MVYLVLFLEHKVNGKCIKNFQLFNYGSTRLITNAVFKRSEHTLRGMLFYGFTLSALFCFCGCSFVLLLVCCIL